MAPPSFSSLNLMLFLQTLHVPFGQVSPSFYPNPDLQKIEEASNRVGDFFTTLCPQT